MADLRGLNLLRNDPEAAARLIAEAESGDMDAQYAAGLVYAEGRGVDPDVRVSGEASADADPALQRALELLGEEIRTSRGSR